jgi:hypothetical protein
LPGPPHNWDTGTDRPGGPRAAGRLHTGGMVREQ